MNDFEIAEHKNDLLTIPLFEKLGITNWKRDTHYSHMDYLIRDKIPVETKIRYVSSTEYDTYMVESRKVEQLIKKYDQMIYINFFTDKKGSLWRITSDTINTIEKRSEEIPISTHGRSNTIHKDCYFLDPDNALKFTHGRNLYTL